MPPRSHKHNNKRQLLPTPIPYKIIYESNLKTIRRRHPEVTGYFDNFTHVQLYLRIVNADNSYTWDDVAGGSLFLVERECYPPYAFYVLNRMGRDDKILPIWPEDEVISMEGGKPGFTAWKTWPAWTKQRLATLPPLKELSPFDPRAAVDVQAMSQVPKESRGAPLGWGLWAKATGGREQIFSVLQRYGQRALPLKCPPYVRPQSSGMYKAPRPVSRGIPLWSGEASTPSRSYVYSTAELTVADHLPFSLRRRYRDQDIHHLR